MRIEVSVVMSDLLEVSGRGMLTALGKGGNEPVELAALGDERLNRSKQEPAYTLTGSPEPTSPRAKRPPAQGLAKALRNPGYRVILPQIDPDRNRGQGVIFNGALLTTLPLENGQ